VRVPLALPVIHVRKTPAMGLKQPHLKKVKQGIPVRIHS